MLGIYSHALFDSFTLLKTRLLLELELNPTRLMSCVFLFLFEGYSTEMNFKIGLCSPVEEDKACFRAGLGDAYC